MSLRGKEVRPFIDENLHEKLSILADDRDLQIAELAARLLEKQIVAEWYELTLTVEKVQRLGKRCKALEGGNS